MVSEIVIYKGKEYDATILSDCIWLRSKSREDVIHGFSLEDGIYYKQVTYSECDAAYRIEKYAIIDGIRCEILGETANDVTVVFDNAPDEMNRSYGLHVAYDRGMYQKTYPKSGMDFEITRTTYDLKTRRYTHTERQCISSDKEV